MQMHILFAGLTLAALTIAAAPVHAKNILVIIADDMGVDKVRSYAADYPGYAPAFLPNTQAIDSLAAAGLRFTRAWATPFCSPTRASFQTGVFPFRHGVGTALKEGRPGVDTAERPMLAQLFSDRDYQTGYFGKWHIGVAPGPLPTEPHPFLAGWDRFFGLVGGYPGADRSFIDWPLLSAGPFGVFLADERQHMTDRISTVALNWINSQTGAWLAVVAFNAPHSPNTSSSSWKYDDTKYNDTDYIPYRTADLDCLQAENCGNGTRVDEAKAVYQALTEHVDLQIGELLTGINTTAMKETLIFFFGDNGTPSPVQESLFAGRGALYEHRRSRPPTVRGKGTLYENGIRVPLIVAAGATWLDGTAGAITTPGRIVEAGGNTMDVFQTVHNHALGISLADVHSTSFTDCFTTTDINCGRPGDSYGYAETFAINANGSISSAQIAVRYGNDKMIATYDTDQQCLDHETFYETATDPFERVPQTWPGLRANRLKDYFRTLHTPEPTSWAYANGPLVDFCP